MHEHTYNRLLFFQVLCWVNPPKIANKNIGTKTFSKFLNHLPLLEALRISTFKYHSVIHLMVGLTESGASDV